MKKNKIALVILDGFGINPNKFGNPYYAVDMNYYKSLCQTYPYTTLQTHGKYVGLPENQMGNSEVGHLHIGSGQVIPQSLNSINQMIENKKFFELPFWEILFQRLQTHHSSLHLLVLNVAGP